MIKENKTKSSEVMKVKRFQDTVLENFDTHRMTGENSDVNREAKRKPG